MHKKNVKTDNSEKVPTHGINKRVQKNEEMLRQNVT